MVSSTEIPNAILNTSIVDGFRGMPVKPITPAVIIKGNKFGIKEMMIILKDRNRNAIKMAINRMAQLNERIKFFIRYFVPFKNNKDFPVIFTPYRSSGKILLIDSIKSSSIFSIRSVLISFM